MSELDRIEAHLQQLATVLPAVERLEAERLEKKQKKDKKKAENDGKLGTNRGIETMFRTSYQVHMELSALADSKANIMISINGLIFSIFLGSLAAKIDQNQTLLLPTAIILISSVLTIIYAVLAARPRISKAPVSLEDVRASRRNILFFANFANMNESDYVEGMKELMTDTNRLYLNMMLDLYSLGMVLKQKFVLLRIAYTIFMYGISIGITLFLLSFARTAFGF